MAGDGQEIDPNAVVLKSGGKTSRVLRPGDIIGDNYRLKGLIGRGGMGYVFRAEHVQMHQEYALKMLAPDQVNEITWTRFQAEGRAIARLDHPNIVKIYNMGVDQGNCPYYVMDFLNGVALSDCIANNRVFSVDEILQMFVQLASGFGYAHSRGIIHRDVKPANVMLLDTGGQYATAKIVDFGIAKLGGAKDVANQSMTATGEIFGSPYYMSPEQCLGTEIDQRSDIYSLGCTLFELLCGQPPFVGQSAVQTVMMHQNKPSPTIESMGGKFSSAEMEALVAKMLMKKPSERYQTMEQVVHDLDRIWQRKAVGKVMDTGFKTSVDSQLEDLEARYEDDGRGSKKRKMILVTCVVTVAGFAALASAQIFKHVSAPVQTPSAIPSSGHVSASDMEAYIQKKDHVLSEDEKKIAAIKSITSSIDKTDGMRVFHCPDLRMGTFCWRRGFKDPAGIDVNGTDDGHVEAFKDSRVPPDVPIIFAMDQGRNTATFWHPSLLAKFGPDELSGLKLEAVADVAEFGTETEKKKQNELVIGLLQAASGWKNCQSMEFSRMAAPDEALIKLDKFTALKQLLVRNSGMDAKVLSERPFLQRLNYLELAPLTDCDLVLQALKGSRSITDIVVLHSDVSAASFQALSNCPNLIALDLDRCQLGPGVLEALTTIKSLKALRISQCQLEPSDIPVLAKFRHIHEVFLLLPRWPKDKLAELRKLLPNAELKMPPPTRALNLDGEEEP